MDDIGHWIGAIITAWICIMAFVAIARERHD